LGGFKKKGVLVNQTIRYCTWIPSFLALGRFSKFGGAEKKPIPSSLTLLLVRSQLRPRDSIDPHIKTPQTISLEDHNKATAAARPPSTPAPRPATFCGLAFFVADAAAEDELEVWLATLEATEETAEETDLEAFDAEDEALLSAEDALDVDDVITALAEDVDEGAVDVDVAVQICETAVGRPVTPESLQKLIA